jgi:hypothetical protein
MLIKRKPIKRMLIKRMLIKRMLIKRMLIKPWPLKPTLTLPIILMAMACGTIQSDHPNADHPNADHPNGKNGVEVKQNMAMKANLTLDRFHRVAAEVRFDEYFGMMTDSAVFVGTDAGEHWRKSAFMEYARPHFDKGKAWTMRAVERHLHFSVDSQFVWFEELLDTRMKLCRGSGVMSRHGQDWLIEQYVLSPTVPNSLMKEVIDTKRHYDDSLLNEINIKYNIK